MSRIATEFWKLFVRVEPRQGYRIPTQIHVYSGTLYDMTLRRSRAGLQDSELESEFVVRNCVTGTTTEFQITYGTSGSRPAVARRITFRPRTWLELELKLNEQA